MVWQRWFWQRWFWQRWSGRDGLAEMVWQRWSGRNWYIDRNTIVVVGVVKKGYGRDLS
jgi:hypothetical protein